MLEQIVERERKTASTHKTTHKKDTQKVSRFQQQQQLYADAPSIQTKLLYVNIHAFNVDLFSPSLSPLVAFFLLASQSRYCTKYYVEQVMINGSEYESCRREKYDNNNKRKTRPTSCFFPSSYAAYFPPESESNDCLPSVTYL